MIEVKARAKSYGTKDFASRMTLESICARERALREELQGARKSSRPTCKKAI